MAAGSAEPPGGNGAGLVYGLHAVAAALERDPHGMQELWVQSNRRDARLGKLLKAAGPGTRVNRVGRTELDDLVPGARHQGVVARFRPGEAAMAVALDAVLARPGPLLLLVLDGVQDPHNLGACLRSADAAGVDAVVVPNARAAGLSPAVRKVACGAAESVPLVQVPNLARALREMGDAGVRVVGTAGEAQDSLYDVDLRGSLALVLGGEERGLRRLTREHCDVLAHIPMAGQVESLNVSVAAGVCLFEARRRRTSE